MENVESDEESQDETVSESESSVDTQESIQGVQEEVVVATRKRTSMLASMRITKKKNKK